MTFPALNNTVGTKVFIAIFAVFHAAIITFKTQRRFTSVANSAALLACEFVASFAGTTEILVFGIHSVGTERTWSCSASFELQGSLLFLFLEKVFLGFGALQQSLQVMLDCLALGYRHCVLDLLFQRIHFVFAFEYYVVLNEVWICGFCEIK